MRNSERITDAYGEHMLCDEIRDVSDKRFLWYFWNHGWKI